MHVKHMYHNVVNGFQINVYHQVIKVLVIVCLIIQNIVVNNNKEIIVLIRLPVQN